MGNAPCTRPAVELVYAHVRKAARLRRMLELTQGITRATELAKEGRAIARATQNPAAYPEHLKSALLSVKVLANV